MLSRTLYFVGGLLLICFGLVSMKARASLVDPLEGKYIRHQEVLASIIIVLFFLALGVFLLVRGISPDFSIAEFLGG